MEEVTARAAAGDELNYEMEISCGWARQLEARIDGSLVWQHGTLETRQAACLLFLRSTAPHLDTGTDWDTWEGRWRGGIGSRGVQERRSTYSLADYPYITLHQSLPTGINN